MKTRLTQSQSNKHGFTLIEIITVIAIIMVLAAMTIGGMGYFQDKVAVSKTQIFMGTVSTALEEYRMDNGVLPKGDGLEGSTELVYIALYGDGIGVDGIAGENANGISDDTEPDGTPDKGAHVYLSTLDPNNKGKSLNVKENANGYVLVDAWKMENDKKKFQELFYRHDPKFDPTSPDPEMMNPPSDFDLWSLGPDGKGGPKGTKEERADDINNWN